MHHPPHGPFLREISCQSHETHALQQIEGAFSVVAMTRTKLIGVRDPFGIRPLVLGKLENGYAFASETCALDAIGARLEREVKPGEMLVVDKNGIEEHYPFQPRPSKFCVFEHIYFSRADSTHNGRSVYETPPPDWHGTGQRSPCRSRYSLPGS